MRAQRSQQGAGPRGTRGPGLWGSGRGKPAVAASGPEPRMADLRSLAPRERPWPQVSGTSPLGASLLPLTWLPLSSLCCTGFRAEMDVPRGGPLATKQADPCSLSS